MILLFYAEHMHFRDPTPPVVIVVFERKEEKCIIWHVIELTPEHWLAQFV